MELKSVTGEMLTDRIRQHRKTLLMIFLPLTVLALLAGILLVKQLHLPGAVLGTVLTALPLLFVLNTLPEFLHPEQADVFRKYGTPEQVAERLRNGCGDVFFDNGRMVVTEQFVLDTEKPETLLFYPHALTVYPDAVQGRESYLVVYDQWGQKLRYPFTNGSQQVIRIDTLSDKIRKHAPGCRGGHRPEDLDYVREKRIALPELPKPEDAEQ